MTTYMMLLSAFIVTLLQPSVAYGADIADEVTDIEEITADSEAARLEAQKARVRVQQEQAENALELKNVRQVRNQAAQSKAKATETLQSAEAEFKRLAAEKAQLNSEIVKFSHDTMVSEKAIEEAKAKLAKMKADIAALEAAKAEKKIKLAEIEAQKMQLMREVGASDDQYALTQRELERALAEEKAAVAELEKSKQVEVVRKVQMDTKIKELKDQIQATRSQAKVLESDVRKYKAHNRRLEGQIEAGMGELAAGGQ